jgi:hypothetical protein
MTDRLDGISVRQIDVLAMRGKGILASATTEHELDFLLHRQLSRSVISIDHAAVDGIAWRSDSFRLAAVLSDGRPISIDQLKKIGAQEGGLVELKPWNCAVEIGCRGTGAPLSSAFMLTGLYEGEFGLNFDDWQIELSSDRDAGLNKKASKGLGIPLEGSTLKISAEGKSQAEHEELATDIMLLLSLASGTGVTCHRWVFNYSRKKQIEFWRGRAGEEMGPGPIVESWRLSTFIEQVLPIWIHMPPGERKVIQIAITHLNNSGSGYLDNRLFQVAQTWEYLAKQWIPPSGLTDAEKELKAKLKKTRGEWSKTHPTVDPKGLIGDRVAKAFDWPVLRRQIESLASQSGIDLSILGLDIEHLKAARDSVAHSISLEGVTTSSGPHHELLMRAQYGLQIMLLQKLQYNDLVVARENGWLTEKKISHLFGS